MLKKHNFFVSDWLCNPLNFRHVFLGFTKCGQFVLSYTHHVEADEHTAYPIYVYRLQWWRFVPYKRLRKVLFAYNFVIF